MPHPLAWLNDALGELDRLHLRRRLRTRTGRQGAVVQLDGREVVNFGSNDYLGLAGDPRVAQAATQVAKVHGWGSGASALIVGRSEWHERLELALAEFEQAEAALVFNTGFAANSSVIAALVEPGDTIFSDALNHASIIDGCRLSRATLRVYAHNDLDELATHLERATCRRRLIVSDSLFSMEGDLARLDELAELANRYEAMLLLDEAHATGVFGHSGRGLAESHGPAVESAVSIRVGTLSKALGGSGGFVTGSRSLIDWLVNRARSYVFSTAPPAAMCAASIEALRIVRDEPERRSTLLTTATNLRERLRQQGWNVGTSASQIIPLVIGDPAAAIELGEKLLARGYFVPAIRPPSVPQDRSLLRLSLSWSHTPEMIDGLLATLDEVRNQGRLPERGGHAV